MSMWSVVRRLGIPCALYSLLLLTPVLTGCGGGKVSRSNYEKVHTGMTEEDVIAVLGPGKDVAATPPKDPKAPRTPAVPGLPANAKTTVWQDGDRSIAVTFANGKVVQKKSTGF